MTRRRTAPASTVGGTTTSNPLTTRWQRGSLLGMRLTTEDRRNWGQFSYVYEAEVIRWENDDLVWGKAQRFATIALAETWLDSNTRGEFPIGRGFMRPVVLEEFEHDGDTILDVSFGDEVGTLYIEGDVVERDGEWK